MRTTLVFPALLLSTLPLVAQNPVIDMNVWTVEDLNGAGPWTIDAPMLYAQSSNTVNTDCSVFYSDFDVTLLDFRITPDAAGGDDDLLGFVLGWNPGDSFNTTADYIVVDWKRLTQTYQDWGTANEGLAISRMTGPFTRGFGGAPIDLWSHTLNCTELMRSPTYGSTGWQFGGEYFFRVIYTPSSVDIWLNGVLEFSLAGTFTPGRFGCYNYSQSRVDFQFALAGAFTAFGSGCQGSAGVPYLFSPDQPLVGEALPIIVANLAPTAFPFVAFGTSDTTWNGTPLPVSLDPLGAIGCTLYTSIDALLPATNFNGTSYMTFAIPPTVAPSTTPLLFTQAIVLDLVANPLGLVLSNAASVSIGIR